MPEFIVKSGVRDTLADRPVSEDLYDALDQEVQELLAEAARRAQANDRRTVLPRDL